MFIKRHAQCVWLLKIVPKICFCQVVSLSSFLTETGIRVYSRLQVPPVFHALASWQTEILSLGSPTETLLVGSQCWIQRSSRTFFFKKKIDFQGGGLQSGRKILLLCWFVLKPRALVPVVWLRRGFAVAKSGIIQLFSSNKRTLKTIGSCENT